LSALSALFFSHIIKLHTEDAGIISRNSLLKKVKKTWQKSQIPGLKSWYNTIGSCKNPIIAVDFLQLAQEFFITLHNSRK
jgi:hypothetical protein